MITKYYVDASGNYLGGLQGIEPPVLWVEVPSAPAHARYIWNGSGWFEVPKTTQELDAEKTAVATDALKLVAACILEAVFDMKANPANYPTAASLKQKALELYKARL